MIFPLSILIMLLVLSSVMIAIAACNPKQTKGATPEPVAASPVETPEHQARSIAYPGMQPGKTTRSEVIAVLGSPQQEAVDTGRQMEVCLYSSDNELIPDAFYFKDEGLQFISAKIREDSAWSLQTITATYGQPSATTFSNYAEGKMMYLYPDLGAGFLVDEQNNAVLFEQLFVPLTLDEYYNFWGKDLPRENPYIR